MEVPKMIINVSLVSNTMVSFKLIGLHKLIRYNHKSDYVTKNGWRITIGDKFQVLKGLTIFPRDLFTNINDDRGENIFIIQCNNETERYNYLKGFSEAMLEFLDSGLCDIAEAVSRETYIKTSDKMWTIY